MVRFAFLAITGPQSTPDSSEYETLGHNIAAGNGFTLSTAAPFIPSVRRPPLYPAFLALLGGRGPVHPYAVASVQIFLDSAVAVAILLLTAAVPMRSVRIAAAVIYALHPAAVAAASTLLTETLFTFLLACAALLVLAARHRDHPTLSILAGIVMGLSVLCRPLGVIYIGSAVLVLLVWRRPRVIAHTAALLIGCALTILPWTYRCTVVTGRVVIAQAAGICNWYLPTRWDWDQNDQTTLWRQFSSDPYGKRLEAARTSAEIVDLNDFGRDQAIRNIKANPRAYLMSRIRTYPHLFISTFGGTIGVHQTLSEVIAQRRFAMAALLSIFLIVFSLLPLAAAAIGLTRMFSNPAISLCAAFVIATLFFHLPMWIEYRYWLPVLPYELALGAAGADLVLRRWRSPAERAHPMLSFRAGGAAGGEESPTDVAMTAGDFSSCSTAPPTLPSPRFRRFEMTASRS
jgi:4-amino-4-deoxy-L-arabinose transferase-like glycosyltransferase